MGSASFFHGLDHFNFALSVYDYCDQVGSKRINSRFQLIENKRSTITNEVENLNSTLFSCKLILQEGRDGYQVYLKTLIDSEDQESLSERAENMQHCYNQSEECYFKNIDGYNQYYKPEITLFLVLRNNELTADKLKHFIQSEIEEVTKTFTKFAKKNRMGIVGSWGSVDYSWILPVQKKVV